MSVSMALTERDLLRVQREHPACRVELRAGAIVVMAPSGGLSEAVAILLAERLSQWARTRKLGFVFGSSAGYRLPNGDIAAPDVSYVSRGRMSTVPADFINVVPDLAVEIRSPSDRLADLREKLELLRSLGTQVTWLIDPEARSVSILKDDASIELTGEDTLTLPTLLPGWSMPVNELWPDA